MPAASRARRYEDAPNPADFREAVRSLLLAGVIAPALVPDLLGNLSTATARCEAAIAAALGPVDAQIAAISHPDARTGVAVSLVVSAMASKDERLALVLREAHFALVRQGPAVLPLTALIHEFNQRSSLLHVVAPSDSLEGVIGWGALSGLAPDAANPATLHAVSDSVYSAAPAIYTIDASRQPAQITAKTIITRDGSPAEKLDLEGIVADGAGGFWLASEGNSEKEVPHAVLHVDASGAITQEFGLPETLMAQEKRFGFEGIALIDGKLWLAVQREWGDDPEGQVKLLQLDPASGEWAGVRYPLDKGEGWVGLSELAVHGDHLYLIERDNLIGDAAKLKAVTRVALADLNPAPLDGELPLVSKETVRDLIPDLKGWNGYVQDKVEGMAITEDGTVWMVTDNDGVDDASGETFFWSFKLD